MGEWIASSAGYHVCRYNPVFGSQLERIPRELGVGVVVRQDPITVQVDGSSWFRLKEFVEEYERSSSMAARPKLDDPVAREVAREHAFVEVLRSLADHMATHHRTQSFVFSEGSLA
jgi:hypothetical protein